MRFSIFKSFSNNSLLLCLLFMSLSLLNCVPCVPCVPAWSKCLPANVPRALLTSHFYLPMYQHANYSTWCANVLKAYQFFNFACQKAYQFFNYISKEFFDFWIFQLCLIFSNFKNICAFLENLPREIKNLNFNICKISLRKNLINLKLLTSFWMEHVGLTKQIFG